MLTRAWPAKGSTELPTGGRRLGSGIHRFFNGSVGQTIFGRKDSVRRSRARSGPGGDEASEPSPRSSRRVDNARAGRWDQLASSGLGGVETPVQRRHAVLPWQPRRSLQSAWVLVFENMGCISRPDASWSFSEKRNRKIAALRPNSGGAEAPSTWASRSKSSESACEYCSPRVDNRAGRSSSEVKTSSASRYD